MARHDNAIFKIKNYPSHHTIIATQKLSTAQSTTDSLNQSNQSTYRQSNEQVAYHEQTLARYLRPST